MTDTNTWVKFEENNKTNGTFTMEPLAPGMGVTIGNSIRRILLSAIPGAAATSVTIDGVQHEFDTIPNVVEDVIDIICNIKSIVFRSHSAEPKKVSINFKGKGSITAADIEHDADIEIINKKQHIAELSKDSKLAITITVENGVGYAAAEANRKDDADVNAIAIDSSFSPILRVNPVVSKIRVGRSLDYDSLETEVWTDGSLSAEDAVKHAATILKEHLELFGEMNNKPVLPAEEKPEVAEESSKDSALDLPVEDLELSARSLNCLKKAGIETVAELIEKDLSELIQIKNFGQKSAEEINEKLAQYSLALKGSLADA